MFLEIKESASALDIGESCGIFGGHQFIPPAADQAVVEIPNQFFVVVLADPEEIYDIEIQVIEHFHLGCLLVEEHLGTTGKGFDIGGVLGQHGNNLFGKAVLAADVGDES